MFFYKNLFFVYFIQFNRAFFVQFLHVPDSFILDIQNILRDYRHGGKIAAKPEGEWISRDGPVLITIILRMKIVYGIISV